MTIYNFLTLVGGLAMFLFGMDVMGKSLEKMGGSKLGTILEKMTDSRIKGVLLGLFVTAVIQSSGAVTVMAVGFVNSGISTQAGYRHHYGCKYRYYRYCVDSFACRY